MRLLDPLRVETPKDAGELLAAPRDASWFRSVGRGGVYHVETRTRGGFVAMISDCGVLLYEDGAILARDVEADLRCRRAACVQGYAKADSA